MLERMVERVTSRYPIEKILPFCKVADNDERPSTDVLRHMTGRIVPVVYCIVYI